MCGVLDLLPTEIPDMQPHRVFLVVTGHCVIVIPRVIKVDANLSCTSRLTRQVFPTSPRPNKMSFCLVERTFAPASTKVIIEDIGGFGGFGSFVLCC